MEDKKFIISKNRIISRKELFSQKEKFHKEQAKLPFEEKIKILVKLQEISSYVKEKTEEK
ncbi:hypothetical protein KKG61_09310 [bacterium]|nr:hypothetical protein [bacterium]MBU1600281.1 hypothetical protein [bacterium]MBU2461725.1 hypothetical protein [bacterium]